jgi:hypothetical protein
MLGYSLHISTAKAIVVAIKTGMPLSSVLSASSASAWQARQLQKKNGTSVKEIIKTAAVSRARM